jgi:hypothetical protein
MHLERYRGGGDVGQILVAEVECSSVDSAVGVTIVGQREPPDPDVELARRVLSDRVVVSHRRGDVVRPPLALATGLADETEPEAARAALGHRTIRDAVVELVRDHVEVEVPVRAAEDILREEEHLHARRLAVRGRPEVRVVRPRTILDLRADGVAASPAEAEVVLLKVPERLGEADAVEVVMQDVAVIEEVHRAGVDVVVRGGRVVDAADQQRRALRILDRVLAAVFVAVEEGEVIGDELPSGAETADSVRPFVVVGPVVGYEHVVAFRVA